MTELLEKRRERRRGPILAPAGSLPPDVLADLVALRNFLEGRDRALEVLIGRKLPRSHLRDELIRMVVIEFGFDRSRTIADYQKACAHLGGHAAVRGELHLMGESGLVMFMPQKRAEWYSTQMPRLMDEVRKFVEAREASK